MLAFIKLRPYLYLPNLGIAVPHLLLYLRQLALLVAILVEHMVSEECIQALDGIV